MKPISSLLFINICWMTRLVRCTMYIQDDDDDGNVIVNIFLRQLVIKVDKTSHSMSIDIGVEFDENHTQRTPNIENVTLLFRDSMDRRCDTYRRFIFNFHSLPNHQQIVNIEKHAHTKANDFVFRKFLGNRLAV